MVGLEDINRIKNILTTAPKIVMKLVSFLLFINYEKELAKMMRLKLIFVYLSYTIGSEFYVETIANKLL